MRLNVYSIKNLFNSTKCSMLKLCSEFHFQNCVPTKVLSFMSIPNKIIGHFSISTEFKKRFYSFFRLPFEKFVIFTKDFCYFSILCDMFDVSSEVKKIHQHNIIAIKVNNKIIPSTKQNNKRNTSTRMYEMKKIEANKLLKSGECGKRRKRNRNECMHTCTP